MLSCQFFCSFATIYTYFIMVRKFDFLVIGSGIAGMSFALKVAHKGSVALICKAGLEEANTYYAQGGIASVTNLKVDNFEKNKSTYKSFTYKSLYRFSRFEIFHKTYFSYRSYLYFRHFSFFSVPIG